MKIAQVCPYFLPVEGGVEKHVYSVSRELVRRGHEVHVHTSARDRNGRGLPREQEVDGIMVHRHEPIWNIGEFGSLWPSFALGIAGGGFDVVHSHVFRHPHTDISALMARFVGSKAVLTSHSPFHPSEVRLPLARGLVRTYDNLAAPFTLKMYDAIICLTRAESKELRAMGAPAGKMVVIPNGVDEGYFDRVEDTGGPILGTGSERRILYLGRINRTKGLDVLLKAFARASARNKDVLLIVAGPTTSPQEEAYKKELERLTSSLRIGDKVVFTGRLSERDKVALLSSCSALVLPSLYEPFGIVLLEAEALGKPVISTLTDGPASIVQDGVTGLLVPPGDVDRLGDSLERILAEPTLAASMSERAKVNAELYRWVRVVDQIEDLYHRTLS